MVTTTLSIEGVATSSQFDYDDFYQELYDTSDNIDYIYDWLQNPHPRRGDFKIELTSPQGTKSALLPYRNIAKRKRCRVSKREDLAVSLLVCTRTGIPKNLKLSASVGGILSPQRERLGVTCFPVEAWSTRDRHLETFTFIWAHSSRHSCPAGAGNQLGSCL